MNKEHFKNEKKYIAELNLAKQLLAMEAITQEDFEIIKQSLIKAYRPVVDSLREAESTADAED